MTTARASPRSRRATAATASTRATCAGAISRRTTAVINRGPSCCRWTWWRRCRSTRPPCSEAIPARVLLDQLRRGRRRGVEDDRHLRRHPAQEIPRLVEAARVGSSAEHHHGKLLTALRQAEQRREAIAGARDVAGFPGADVDVGTAEERIRRVDADD